MDKVRMTFEWIRSGLSGVQAAYHFNALTIVLGLFCLYLLYILIYGIFLCPTRHIPGPFVARFGTAYYQALFFGGSISLTIHELHKKYGMSFLCHIKLRSRSQTWSKQNQC
jgi:hypothetical protein